MASQRENDAGRGMIGPLLRTSAHARIVTAIASLRSELLPPDAKVKRVIRSSLPAKAAMTQATKHTTVAFRRMQTAVRRRAWMRYERLTLKLNQRCGKR